ncbi:sulfotransferase 1C2-like [Mya arenaria]|uniref:sulfotransferase 1C2-like n=1 Tax=Mya arenaria TaxID=6604 RepID=UPI0022E202AD|nr:sulfotransferase 1C2-like [Mya arenaria]
MAEEISAPQTLFEYEYDRFEAMYTFDDDIRLCGYPRPGVDAVEELKRPRTVKCHLPSQTALRWEREGFLGKSLTEDDVTKISAQCHIKQMSQNPTTNGEYFSKYMHARDGVGKFINKGQPGIWRDILSSEMSDKLDVLIKRLDGSGLSYGFC